MKVLNEQKMRTKESNLLEKLDIAEQKLKSSEETNASLRALNRQQGCVLAENLLRVIELTRTLE